MFGSSKSNLWLDLTIFLAFVITALTGLMLWLLLPHGRGSSELLFWGLSRDGWTDIHDWAGVVMLAGASLHIFLHWKWFYNVAKRYFRRLARQARINFTLNSLLFLAFVIVNFTGLLVWLVLPDGGYRGGRNPMYNATILSLTRHEWNDLHLWSGLAILAILLIHVSLHWKWILYMLRNYSQAMLNRLSNLGSPKKERALT